MDTVMVNYFRIKKAEIVQKKKTFVHDMMAPLKQREKRSRLTEIWLTASSGRSSSSSSACRRGKGIGQGHVTRTRNIGYILGLAGGGRLASQGPRPLKGRATLEGVDYVNLWEESGTEEDKWLLIVTETKWQHRLTGWVTLTVSQTQHDGGGGDSWRSGCSIPSTKCWIWTVKTTLIISLLPHLKIHAFNQILWS